MFAFRDGLTDYDEDYTAIGMVDQVVRTAYQAGQGYLEVADATAPTDAPMDDTGETADALSPVSAASEAPSVEAVPTNAVAQSDPPMRMRRFRQMGWNLSLPAKKYARRK